MAYNNILTELGIRNGSSEKLECIAERDQSVVLRKSCGELCEVGKEEYRCLIAGGHASPLNAEPTAGFIPDEHARITQSMKLHAVRRDDELRRAGNSARKSAEIIGTELRENPRFIRYVPAQFGLRTLQHWKQCKSKDGRSALLPKTHLKGNRGERYDELYEEIALDALEGSYLKNDRISIGKLSDLVSYRYEQAWYKKHGADTHKQLNPHGKRSLVAVLRTLRVDDIISYRHDSETAKKLRLQAQFFHRVQMPFDLVEVDCTPGNIHLVGVDRTCIGRPTFSIAVDAVTGVPVGLRISLTAPREELTVQTLKDVMTDRGDAFFEKYNIENRFEMTGVPQIISSDQGSENSGGHLSSLIEQSGAEWGKNAPGCPEKKPFVERFNRELSEFLQTLPGSTHTKELPNKERTEKGMLEACLTLEELEALVMKWLYDVYALKVRRRIQSPLRVAETPTQSWKRLQSQAVLPPAPEDITEWFMVEKTVRKVWHYGIEVEGVLFHSPELGELIKDIGVRQSLDVRYDPTDCREIAVIHESLAVPLIVPAKSDDVAAVSFADAKRMRVVSQETKKADLKARSTSMELALEAQKRAEEIGRGKVKSLKSARAKEAMRRKHQQILENSKVPPRSQTSAVERANQPTPKAHVRRRSERPAIEQME
ncbi:Mu transposase C-terminal domain-containing protein [Sulfitobacter geojensis]|uniref:Mu transposase C-terminal domain-containing protein n=1 Tax=Sulfitobacter geojensis TaxID=1342299 RepID=UPI00248F8C81|nr:Mu transposase C-terminal domain-containing protein [Sulfitobacter geojensis]